MLTSAEPQIEAIGHVPSLDGIRALSFFLVFLAHAGLNKIIPGGLGVTVFFFLSGYLITTLLRQEEKIRHTISLRGFYYRRFLRIFPPMYITLGAAILLQHWALVPGSWNTTGLLAQALHFTNYALLSGRAQILEGTSIFWSLSVEEHFYFLYPLSLLLFFRLRGTGARPTFLWIAVTLVLVWRIFLIAVMHSPFERTYLSTDTRIDSILFGCILALRFNPLDKSLQPSTRIRALALTSSALILLFSLVMRGMFFRETLRYTLQGLALMPIFFFSVREFRNVAFAWLNHPWLSYVGKISYALYLVHLLMLQTATRLFPHAHSFVIAILGLGLSLSYAVLLRIFIEKPLAKMRIRHQSI